MTLFNPYKIIHPYKTILKEGHTCEKEIFPVEFQ